MPVRPPLLARVAAILACLPAVAATTRPAADRSFTFTYAAAITGLTYGQRLRVWLPVPPSDDTQTVEIAPSSLPTTPADAVEPRFGNRMLYFDVGPNHGRTVSMEMNYRVTRREVNAPLATGPVPSTAAMSDPAALLRPDAKVPVGGKPADLLRGRPAPTDPTAAARLVYDLVDDHLQYRKDQPGWGTGDATWACGSGFGNCTDFHSLYISLARTRRLPSAFQIGFQVGPEPAGPVDGYHCWAWSKVADGWLPVDVADASRHPDRRASDFGHLPADRVAFSVGRDLDLVPKQAGPPLNFFVYPYVEVAGVAVPQERIDKRFAYAPLPSR